MTENVEKIEEVVNVNDIVKKRLEQEAIQSVESLLKNEQSKGITFTKEDLARPLTFGEARKLVAEINGSFDKISQWIGSINAILTNQSQSYLAIDDKIKAINDELERVKVQSKPLPLPDVSFSQKSV